MKRKVFWGCVIPVTVLILGFIGLFIYFFYLGNWYEQVQAELPEVKQKLIGLNHATLTNITPPNEVVEIKREDLGVFANYDYGVSTNVDYQIESSELDIQGYYETMLIPLGWTLLYSTPNPQNIESREYYLNETCLRVTTYPKNKDVYDILIYHDFNKQSFSPNLPPMWYVQGIREMGKTNIHTCP